MTLSAKITDKSLSDVWHGLSDAQRKLVCKAYAQSCGQRDDQLSPEVASSFLLRPTIRS